ncbi:MAG: response regulator [Pseudanabaenaceae cyanobacterium bins.68]|nr:response regulator [Pseudanabaenaceae cyanobacterium bins.68]
MSTLESEIELQQELRQLFDLDTQKYIQVYLTTVQQIQPSTWQQDIQQLYRAIHTIKGGAATVGNGSILAIAKVLEDLLSDLRYLEQAPPLEDGKLQQSLLEAGELLSGSLELTDVDQAIPIANYIQALHQTIKQDYMGEMDEQAMLWQEFAEQGFDLVVLDLDMAVEALAAAPDALPENALDSLVSTVESLSQIGADLSLGQAWQELLAQAQEFHQNLQPDYWQQQVPQWLQALKASAKQGGKPIGALPAPPQSLPELNNSTFTNLDLDPELAQLFAIDTQKDLQTYLSLVPQLADLNWKDAIQQLYRSIHTIKGGAATIGADPILQVAGALEDILSDLRNQELPPALNDGNIVKILLEAGELLLGALPLDTVPQASVEQIRSWRLTIQADYLAEMDDKKLLFKEFAEQGFDLVVLELEIALEQLTADQPVPESSQAIAQQTIAQLQEIGAELEMGSDWQKLLDQGQQILAQSQSNIWLQQFPTYLTHLKQCAKLGGILPVSPRVTTQPESRKRRTAAAKTIESQADVQIAVPLERLDRTSQFLVQTLMSTRATQGFYQAMHDNLIPLIALAKNSVQYINQLREMQDDFATLDVAKSQEQNGVQVEGYRQGYLAINRLLEINLRLIELGAEINESSRQTDESLKKLDLGLRGLQQTIEESRLVPFETLALRARGILRDLTVRVGKPASLNVIGEKTELDAGTLRNLEPVMLHLIRNSYDHGIEPAELRRQRQKPEKGQIEIAIARRGSVFVLEIKDDGGGIDPHKISQIAINKGLPLTDTSNSDKLLTVLCQSGFTSATNVSDISGRGVGMDVVANQVAAMGGQLSLETRVGVGTKFRIQLPVPHLFVRCMLVQAGDRIFAIPAAEIFTTMVIDDLLYQTVDRPSHNLEIEEETGMVPALKLIEYWKGDGRIAPLISNSVAVRTKLADSNDGIWLIADFLYGQNDLLVNPMPAPLESPLGIFGVSLLADGTLVPVIDGKTMIEAILGKTALNLGIPATSTSQQTHSRDILIVDDAALMRRRIEAALTAKGYVVHTCSDGLEAWEWLQNNPQPALLLTDIEMPRMDGFTLIDRCRHSAKDMPIVVISSRLAEEWAKETRRIGANDYLTKGFSTADLLEKVAMYMEQAHA